VLHHFTLLFREPYSPPPGWEEGLLFEFYRNILHGDRWQLLLEGLYLALQVTFGGLALGLILGFVLALFRISNIRVLRWFSGLYITIIRGTPLMLQLLIWHFAIFAGVGISSITLGIIAFAVNSGAYVCEIFRAGILSVDKGQTEAGRSLGLTKTKNMSLVVMPQALKNSLPSLVNEFIMLFKETALLGAIAVTDLTRAANMIRANTFSPFFPLVSAAIVYIIIVTLITWGLGILERRLRKSDTR